MWQAALSLPLLGGGEHTQGSSENTRAVGRSSVGLVGGMMLAVAREVMNESVKASVDKTTRQRVLQAGQWGAHPGNSCSVLCVEQCSGMGQCCFSTRYGLHTDTL